MKGDILFLCQFFYPENVSSATLPFDTAKHLASSGFKVGALCGYPKEYFNAKTVPLKETVSNVDIKRLKYIQPGRKSKIGRLVNYFSFTLSAFLHIGTLKKYKSVIVYSNPPILPAVAVLAKKLFKIKVVFVAYDIYPEIGYASGIIKKGNIIDRVMHKLNRSLYRNADRVVTLTDEMKEYILSNRDGITGNRITSIANWAHEKFTTVTEDAYKHFGYKNGQFVVSYFGNMGICQDVETMLQAAKLLKNNDEIKFLIVGHGNKKQYVANFIADNELNNVHLLDYLIGDDFEKAVAITSCCVVSLENGLKGMCAPSKYYSYLQGGHPIIAIVESGSYLAEEVVSEMIGCHVEVGDSEELCNHLKNICNNIDERLKMGERARHLYLNRYDKNIAMNKYQTMFDKLLVE